MKNKGQLSLGDAPSVVMIVGMVFLIMATIAYISYQFGASTRISGTAGTVVNESVTSSKTTGLSATLAKSTLNDASCGTITRIINGTNSNYVIEVANFTQTGCTVVNATSTVSWGTTLLFSYPYTYSSNTVATNITESLETQLSNNTSIAGIVLTISLVGIVLTVLIGVFVLVGRRRV
jgi:hypothetical protein